MSKLRRTRARHLMRRVREVPLSFILAKLGRLGTEMTTWPFWALSRWMGSLPLGHPGHRFKTLSTRLRAAIIATAADDSEYELAIGRRSALVLDNREFPCLGYGLLHIPRGHEWRADSTADHAWPSRFFPFVDFLTHGRTADVKVPWELSRMQWLTWLAEASVAHSDVSERVRARSTLVDTLRDWSSANPVGYGPNWAIGMEVAIRAVNIGLAAAILWPDVDPASRRLMGGLLSSHAKFLRRFPETSDIPGNHALLCAVGTQFLDEVVFSEDDASAAEDRWRRVLSQFEADGIHIEHAPLYHRLCTEALLWSVSFHLLVATSRNEALLSLAERAASTLAALEMSSGTLPVIGDNDSGQVILIERPSTTLRYLRQLAGVETGSVPLMAAVADSSEFKRVSSGLNRTDAHSPRRLGPFLRLGNGEFDVLLRAGPHGLMGRASHDHDDNASPWISVAGRELAVDAGCYAYTRDFAKRASDLSSVSHNVVTVDARNRFVPRPGSISITAADAPVPESVNVRSDGSAVVQLSWSDREAGRVFHEREFRPDGADRYVIADTMELEHEAPVSVWWHLAPGWSFAADGSGFIATCSQDAVGVRFTVESDPAETAIEAVPYRFSSLYGSEEVATCVGIRARASRTQRIRTTLQLLRRAPDPSTAKGAGPTRA
jgi:hypothetical protein